jgi:hypothetical protein
MHFANVYFVAVLTRTVGVMNGFSYIAVLIFIDYSVMGKMMDVSNDKC